MSFNPGRAAAMAGQELQELARIAFIGLDGFGREPALARKHRQPGLSRGLQVGSGGDQEFLHGTTRWRMIDPCPVKVSKGVNDGSD